MSTRSRNTSAPALTAFPAFALHAGDAAMGLILICDHADNRVPAEYGDLGLPAGELHRHIAYDPGAAEATRRLARRLGAPAVLSTFSRLLIDPNRGEDDPTLIMRLSDGAIVPGNARIGPEERDRRIARFHAPYHGAIDGAVAASLAAGVRPALVSLHSFTPVWRGAPRPWHAGVLWNGDGRLALPLIAALRSEAGLVIGDNEPYSGALPNDTLDRHATRRGLANVLIEIRQDLIGEDAGIDAWVERLAPLLEALNASPQVHAAPAQAGVARNGG